MQHTMQTMLQQASHYLSILNLSPPRIIGLLAAVIAATSLLFLTARNGSPALPSNLAALTHTEGASSSHARPSIDDVFNKTLGFEQVLVLNMPARTDHRDAISLSAAITGFHVRFIDGVVGTDVSPKAIPDTGGVNFEPGLIGSWRAHMNAMHEIINNDLGSALIFEDDVDWDIRLKPLLRDFALSANAIQHVDRTPREGKGLQIDFDNLPSYPTPRRSPYGDDWDVLWLGHCGMRINAEQTHVVHEQDPSVPQVQYLKSWEEGVESPLAPYGNHVRLVGRNDGTCTLAYAVSQAGARKILFDMGITKLWSAFDVMLAAFCQNGGRCLGSLPQLFDHHRAMGPRSKESEISGADGFREKAVTNNIRWSVRLNMKKLLDGQMDLEDQYPDV